MDKLTEKILADLYKLDPSLKGREEEIVKLVGKLLASRPDAEPDENFYRELRSTLMVEFAEADRRPVSALSRFVEAFTGSGMRYALGGAGVMAAVALIAVYAYLPQVAGPEVRTTAPKIALSSGMTVSHLADNAFGRLSGSSAQPAAAQVGLAATEATPAPSAAKTMSAIGLGGGGAATTDMKMMPIYRPSVSYQFKYDGTLNLTETKVTVLERQGSLDTTSLANIIGRVDLGVMDLGRLRNLTVNNLTVSEDRDNGYQVNIDFQSGSVNIYQNWTRWPQAEPVACSSDGTCTQPDRLTESDMLSDSEAIAIADSFIKEMGLSTANYGQPTVDNSWRQYYAQTEPKSDFWFPQQINVQYPLMVDGKYVYFSDGRKEAMNVTVDVKNRRAAGVSPIYSQSFAGSDYEAITDSSAILDYALQGGVQPMYGEGAEKIVEVKLGEPELAWYSYWSYTENKSHSLLVPALVFPITDKPSDQAIYLENVVVPLVKDLIQPAYPVLYKGLETPPAPPVQAEPAPAVEPAEVK